MSAGGNLSIPFAYKRSGVSQLYFQEEPQFSYFVWDNLSITILPIQAEISLRWSRIHPVSAGIIKWGAMVGAEYYFPVGYNLFPFVGLRGGVRIQNLLWNQAQGVVQTPIGLLWAMNQHVALSFAIPVTVAFSGEFGFESVEVTPGYFGVVGFF